VHFKESQEYIQVHFTSYLDLLKDSGLFQVAIFNQKLKKRNKNVTITKQNIPLLDGRPKVKNEVTKYQNFLIRFLNQLSNPSFKLFLNLKPLNYWVIHSKSHWNW